MPPKSGSGDKLKQKSLTSFFGKASSATNSSSSARTPDPKSKLKAGIKGHGTSSISGISASGLASSGKRRKSDAAPSSDPAGEDAAMGPEVLRTPLKKNEPSHSLSQSSGIAVRSAKYSRSSAGGTSARDTPPTSDPISTDINMVSDDEQRERRLAERNEKAPSTLAPVGPSLFLRILCNLTVVQGTKRPKRKIVIEDSEEEDNGGVDATAYKKGLSAYRPSPEPHSPKSSLDFD